MRLINTNTLVLAEFIEDSIPPYAILSHTWDNDEVLFEQMRNFAPSLYEKRGLKKITQSCRIARELGLDWVWVDTCCIDKSSSAELTEAINSMFRWYQASAVCLVYLADVASDVSETLENPERTFSHARWFTRGWTLQELIAPRNCIFYDREWVPLGAKSALSPTLSAVTGVPVDLLSGRTHLEQYSVAERMGWAANRITTRSEDQAYCLMGIFDVNMPLLYGEGRKAFRRLEEEIERQQRYSTSLKPSVIAREQDARNLSAMPAGMDSITESGEGVRTFLIGDKAAGETQAVDHITDSGYDGSGAIKSQSRGKVLGESPYVALVATIPESPAESTDCETQTVYSDTESLRDLKLLKYVTAFSDELYRSLPAGFDKAKFERVLPLLDELLRTFAFKVSCDGSTPENRNLMYLVHRYRR
jgi:hypothetical protein